MPVELKVTAHLVGQRQPLCPDWFLPLFPGGPPASSEPLTLRNVITRVVLHEVEAFRERQAGRRLVRVLTERAIEAGLTAGRVDAGGRDLRQPVDDHHAVAAALQAFEDGLYLVFLDGEEQRHLDREVHVHADSELKFIRLTMLAGA